MDEDMESSLVVRQIDGSSIPRQRLRQLRVMWRARAAPDLNRVLGRQGDTTQRKSALLSTIAPTGLGAVEWPRLLCQH